MNVSEILQMIRDETGLTTGMVSNTELLLRLNLEYKKLWASISDLNINYGWAEWTANLVAGQNQYALLKPTSYYEATSGGPVAFTVTYAQVSSYNDGDVLYVNFNQNNNVNATINVNSLGAKKIYIDSTTQITGSYFGTKLFVTLQYDSTLDSGNGGYLILDYKIASFGQYRIERIEIKYGISSDYIKADLRQRANFDLAMEDYETKQDQEDPFVIITDKVLFLYPTPKINVASGMILQGVKSPYDLNINMVDDDILIPLEYHDVLAMAVMPWAWRRRQLQDRRIDAQNDFLQARENMLYDLSYRKTSPVQGYNKGLSYLE